MSFSFFDNVVVWERFENEKVSGFCALIKIVVWEMFDIVVCWGRFENEKVSLFL